MARQLDIFEDGGLGDFARCAAELSDSERRTVAAALDILARHLRRPGAAMDKPEVAADYLKLTLSAREREIFTVLFLDNQNRLIAAQDMFLGTIDSASVYPREIVKECLRLNAAAIIVAHNHPSGVAEPSRADRDITRRIKAALDLVDVRLLDHLVIGGTDYQSFAQMGLMP